MAEQAIPLSANGEYFHLQNCRRKGRCTFIDTADRAALYVSQNQITLLDTRQHRMRSFGFCYSPISFFKYGRSSTAETISAIASAKGVAQTIP